MRDDEIPAPEHLSAAAAAVWDELVNCENGYTPAPGFDAYCNQIALERQCATRIATEGFIVADAKGVAIPHPALEIQRKAQVEIRGWAGKFRRR